MKKFKYVIFEPAAGEGHISKVLKRAGYTVVTSDIVARGESLDFIQDFFEFIICLMRGYHYQSAL